MTDNQLFEIIIPIITAGLIADGFTGINVWQSSQPTQQGIPTTPTIYLQKISDVRYGFLYFKDTWDPIEEKMIHVERQAYETTFQVNAMVLQDPTNTSLYTASDLVNEVAAIMQSPLTIQSLISSGISILRVQSVRNPYLVDDRDQFEASSSFDFVITHNQTRTVNVPVIDSETLNIYRV